MRPRRVGDLIRDELSTILSRDVEDPRVGLVTVTEVEMSPDLKVAKVFLSPVDPAADVAETIRVLERAAGFIRKQLVRRRLPIRHLPELRFQHDDSIARGSRIDRLLEELRPGERDAAPPEEEEG
jgi:ribosome-binding factor A